MQTYSMDVGALLRFGGNERNGLPTLEESDWCYSKRKGEKERINHDVTLP